MRFSARTYSRVTFVALVLLCTIVVTGAAVRLSGSGLGCADWPRCNSQKFIDVSSTHGAIEQVNRLFTGLVAAGVALAVLGSYRLSERRRDLVRLSWGLVAGVVGQVVLGGVVVLTDLHPLANQGHFVLSMILVSTATVLWERSRTDVVSELTEPATIAPLARRLVGGVVIGAVVSILTGTVVTGTGPHAGDEESRRFGFDIESVARLHGSTVLVTVALLLGLIVVVRRRSDSWERLGGPLEALLAIAVVQGTVGYVQYFNDIPAVLVGVHVAGATALMIAVVRLAFRVFSRPSSGAGVLLGTR
ncbi:MAG: COX15/CtaA family protein [Actinomycetota bacterium]